ncbi:4Fe-4S binding protein [Bacteroides uniformis]|uniref:4Fe-4S binding protein n=1 Tax=Bacteroides uniformis TaxID=820 RepID=UPI003F8D59FF
MASENPIKTDEGQCISCGRCIVLCPVGSRNYHYPFLGKKSLEFASANSERKELELFYAVN